MLTTYLYIVTDANTAVELSRKEYAVRLTDNAQQAWIRRAQETYNCAAVITETTLQTAEDRHDALLLSELIQKTFA